MRITFLGAAREVTGSSYLIETGRVRLLVDCGLFQGGRPAERKNLESCDFPFLPEALDLVVVTHAHLDHSGLLPRLTALGYRGPILATEATCDLLKVLLLDSAHIQEKEAERENRRRHIRRLRKGSDRAPLYTVTQAQACLRRLVPSSYDRELSPVPGVRLMFRDAGHILGSAIVEMWLGQGAGCRKLVFSGDLGQPARPVLKDPTPIDTADVLLVESTYGNRLHKSLAETEDELVAALDDTLHRKGGNVIMPAFAVGRTQEVLYLLTDLVRRGRLSPFNIYVDSPMAKAATEVTLRHPDLLDQETHDLIAWQRSHPERPRIHFVEEVEESMALNHIAGGVVIIAASGMCDAGRIKYHLYQNLARAESSVVITGFQAAGTLGRRLVDGAKRVRIFGDELPVRADIHTIGGLSAHGDRAALLAWLGHFQAPPGQCFVVHGEAETALSFAESVKQLGWNRVAVPEYREFRDLD